MERVGVACALLLACACAQNSPVDGNPLCKCIGALSSKLDTFDCDHPWAKTGKCVNVDDTYGDINWWKHYPANYGTQCQQWPEPAQSVCFNASEAQEPKVPQELLTPTKAWCTKPWCYVDPCKCEAADVAASSVFDSLGEMYYSYSACGSMDLFTGEYAEDKVGSGNCDVKVSGAKVLASMSASAICFVVFLLRPF